MTILAAVLAGLALAGAFGVLAARHPVRGILALVLNLTALAVLYLTLQAEFLAVIQVIVYAGAVMILFLFVVSLLTARRTASEGLGGGLAGQEAAAWPVCAVLAAALVAVASRATPLPQLAGDAASSTGQAAFGSVVSFGVALLTTHLLAFELTAFLLLIAVLGVVVLVGGGAGQGVER